MKAREINPVNVARFVEQNIYEEVAEFHAKTNYTNIPGVAARCYLSSASDKILSTLTQTEAPLWGGFEKSYKITNKRSDKANKILRNESANRFSDSLELQFSLIEQLVTDAFTARSETSSKRPYPSGGALYPIEVFLCKLSNNIDGWPLDESVLHILPLSKSLEALTSPTTAQLLKVLSGNNHKVLGTPHFALVYTVFLEKAIFKYRYRGYRLALLEAGSMYQMADICGKNLGFSSRMWAGFTDYQVAKTMGVNCKHIAPLAIQFFDKRSDYV